MFCKQESKREIPFPHYKLASFLVFCPVLLGTLQAKISVEILENFVKNMRVSGRFFKKVLPNLYSIYCICDSKWVYHFRTELQWSLFRTPYLYRIVTKISKYQASQFQFQLQTNNFGILLSVDVLEREKIEYNSRNKIQDTLIFLDNLG